MPDQFSDIRPYKDDEVAAVLQRLLASHELHKALLSFYAPKVPASLRGLFAYLLRLKFARQLKGVNDIEAFQLWLTSLLAPMLKRTSSHIEVRGLENLTKGKAYLWLSNHRDIAMDPLLMNVSLHQAGWPTSRIAIGDNLLTHPDVAAIMRLNKSFIVKRNINNRREKLKELQKLSAYIRHSIEENQSIWIAQREGRAKNGIDKTDTAVLKMLALHGRTRSEDFQTTMAALNPVPVYIQYEWDPCDLMKAKELVAIAEQGHYHKAANEDTISTLLGLTGQKGRITVSFAAPLSAAEYADADTMAQSMDAKLNTMQEILPVQRTALALLQQLNPEFNAYAGAQLEPAAAAEFERRLLGQSAAVRERLLKTYAAPLLMK